MGEAPVVLTKNTHASDGLYRRLNVDYVRVTLPLLYVIILTAEA
jgi:hypothetical protein